MVEPDLELVDPAPVGRRLVGALIDAGPIVALVVLLLVLDEPLVRWILLGCLPAYLLLLWAWAAYNGQGPGKSLTGVRVIDAGTGRRPGAWPALVRQAARGVLALGTLGVAGLSYRWDPEGLEQTWWDRVAGSRVVAVGSGAGVRGARRGAPGDPFGADPAPAGMHRVGADDPVTRARWTPDVMPVVAVPPVPIEPPVPPVLPISAEPARAGLYTPVTLAPSPVGPPPAGPSPVAAVEAPTARVPPPGRTGLPSAAAVRPAAPDQRADLPMIRNVPLPAQPSSAPLAPAQPPSAQAAGDPGDRTVSLRARTVTLAWDSGRTVVVTGRVLLGREPEPDPGEVIERALAVETDSRGVSKTHLSIDVGPAGVTVTDRHSTNGVRLVRPDGIGARIPAGEPVDVWVGDRLEFGGRSLRITQIGP